MIYFKTLLKFSFLVLFYFILSSFFLNKLNLEVDLGFGFKRIYSREIQKINFTLENLTSNLKKSPSSLDSAKIYLSKARVEYKSIEPFVIAFFPGDARFINRPIILEMAEDDEITNYVEPHGFQYIESMLYSDSVRFFRKRIISEIDNIYSLLRNINQSIESMEIHDRDVFDAMQMHLIRQFMLGFANFETAESRTGVQESKALLISYEKILLEAYPLAEGKQVDVKEELFISINNAVAYLNEVKAGEDPDYFKFYMQYYIPVSEKLVSFRDYFVREETMNTTAINFHNRSVFDPHAFNSNYFLPAKRLSDKERIVELGKILFFDPVLSANNLRACASCHQPDKGFSDGLPKSQAFEPGKFLTRNAPTIVNAVFQRKLFHDGRAFTFEDQAGQVMSNALEMHNDFSQVALKLRTSPEYVRLFRNAYVGTEDTIISNRSILTSIAEYERSIVGMNSRFDKTISGREDLLTADEKEGFNIYMGKGNCASCHFIPLFNGLMPPDYVETEWEIIGVPELKQGYKPKLDPDIGRAGVIDVPIFRHAFKTPTLRNIEVTGPYMHNGVFKTLEEVIEFYDVGGGSGLGYKVPLQTLSSDSLLLTPTEKFQLISFLKSLTDTTYLTSKPSQLPLFPGEDKLNERPIGGDY